MSASQTPAGHEPGTTPAGASGDPSMEDILASIRRILSEDEAPPAAAGQSEARPPADDVLVLDPAMMVNEPTPTHEPQAPTPVPVAAPTPSAAELVAPEAAAATASSVEGLVRALTERTTRVRSNGPTIEDLVREELRPMLKSWLDANLPPLVERLVRAEIERVVGRAVP
jgi:cell pole-organizing protein PopZ